MNSIFFNSEEFISIFEIVFSICNRDFLAQDTQDPEKIKLLSRVVRYFNKVIRRRASRRVPLAVELTFQICKFYVDRQSVISTTSDLSALDVLMEALHVSSAAQVYKTVNQIVDLNQKSKFAVSFHLVLKKLEFAHADIISQIRHSFFHQETPNLKNIELSFRLLLGEIKTLYWDKNYAWLMSLRLQDTSLIKTQLAKYHVEPLTKAETNNVDEYCDQCLLQKDLLTFLSEPTPSIPDFLKNKVKGLHRKSTLVHLLSSSLLKIYSRNILEHREKLSGESKTMIDTLLHVEDMVKELEGPSRAAKLIGEVLEVESLGKRKQLLANKLAEKKMAKRKSGEILEEIDPLAYEQLTENRPMTPEAIESGYQEVVSRWQKLLDAEQELELCPPKIRLGSKLSEHLSQKQNLQPFKKIILGDLFTGL